MKRLIMISNFLFVSTIAFGQTNDLPNREPFTLKLAVDETIYYQDEIQKMGADARFTRWSEIKRL